MTIRKFPTVTERASKNFPELNQCYLSIGDHLNAILTAGESEQVKFAIEKPFHLTVMLALVSIFQLIEGYTDQKAAEAIQSRADWKYALNLPLTYSGFDPTWLCNFRKYTFNEPSGTALVQKVIDHLVGIDAFDLTADKAPLAEEVLTSICKLNRIVQIIETMLFAVEALTTCECFQLKDICLPELFERYSRTYLRLQEVETSEEMNQLAQTIGSDISRLWNSLQLFEEDRLKQWPEMEHLWNIWREQYRQLDHSPVGIADVIWDPVNCLHCELGSGALKSP